MGLWQRSGNGTILFGMVDSSALRSIADDRPSRLRSAVTNGRKLFVSGDGRSPWARRYRDLIAGHLSDLGGPENVSAGQASLIRRAAALECELEAAEGRLASGENGNLSAFASATNSLRRLLATLGLERKASAEPSLAEYIAATYGAAENAPADRRRGKRRKSRTRTTGSPSAAVGPSS
jgi:hypothetical protein